MTNVVGLDGKAFKPANTAERALRRHNKDFLRDSATRWRDAKRITLLVEDKDGTLCMIASDEHMRRSEIMYTLHRAIQAL